MTVLTGTVAVIALVLCAVFVAGDLGANIWRLLGGRKNRRDAGLTRDTTRRKL